MTKLAPMSLAQAIELAPAIATDHPHPYKGESFTHINTKDVLTGMLDNGFAIRSVDQARGRITERGVNTGLYNQHVVRLRLERDFNDISVGDSIPEVVMFNSHDGSGCFMLTAGLFRLICSNGMVVGESYESLRLRHRYLDTDTILGEAKRIWEHVPELNDWRVEALKRELDPQEQSLFAAKAAVIRFPDRANSLPFHPDKLLETRRMEDKGTDLWHTYNRVQENVIRGGLEGRSANGRITRMREITGVASDIEINRQLWDLADQYLHAA